MWYDTIVLIRARQFVLVDVTTVEEWFILQQLDNKPIKHSVEFNDFAIVLGAVCCPEIDAFSWVEVHSQDVDSVIFHLDMNLCPSVFVLVNLRDR